jgi:hypothetical protein
MDVTIYQAYLLHDPDASLAFYRDRTEVLRNG